MFIVDFGGGLAVVVNGNFGYSSSISKIGYWL